MAILEEDRAKTRGIALSRPALMRQDTLGVQPYIDTLLPSSPEAAGAGVRQGITGLATGARKMVMESSPVKDIRAMAPGVTGFARGLFGGQGAIPKAPTQPQQQSLQTGAPAYGTDRFSTDQMTPTATTTPTTVPPTPAVAGIGPARPEMKFSGAVDTERFQRLGMPEMLRSPSPNIANTLLRDPETGEYTVRETISGGPGAPTLRQPINPALWTGTPEALAETNRANEAYNQRLMAGWTGRGTQWAAQEGGVPLQQAQAGQAEIETALAPELAAGVTGLQGAQSQEAAARAEAAGTGQWQNVTYEEPGTRETAFQPTKRAVQVHSITGEQRPIGGISAPLANLRAQLSPEQQKKAVKYGTENPTEDKASILRRVIAGEI